MGVAGEPPPPPEQIGKCRCYRGLDGLTPLFWTHVRPYGEVRLDLGSRLTIGAST